MRRLWRGAGLLVLAQFLGASIYFLLSGSRRKKSPIPVFIDVGPVEDFAPDSVTLVRRGEFYLNRFADGGFLALSRRCTHLGCAVTWDRERKIFTCPCHASSFSRDGSVLKSPAPRPLDLHPLIIEKGRVKIDIGTRRRRTLFSPQQLGYPAGKQKT
ncbi:MAG: Rieske (2Fe-2S) protein [Deltaproteobacteria bacterium]|nr:Rieske (2Fe-2S) protein [Deltaproteobacteria bacterium]